MTTRSVRFAVSGGTDTGMGHVMRSVTLAREARRRGLSVDFALDGDAPARAAIADALPATDVGEWSTCTEGEVDWIVFDTRRELSAELERAGARGIRTLAVDTLDWIDRATRSVVPALHAPDTDDPRVLAGPDFCVVSEGVRTRPTPLYPGCRNTVLVTLGGADPHALTEFVPRPLANCLAEWEGEAPEVDAVIGPAYRQPERAEAALRQRGWRVHRAPSQSELAPLMRSALFACAGFGTTLQDLAWLGVPFVYVTHHGRDRSDALRLEGRGVGRLGGEGPSLDATSFTAVLEKTLLDPEWRIACSRRGRELLGDGRGAERIVGTLLAPDEA